MRPLAPPEYFHVRLVHLVRPARPAAVARLPAGRFRWRCAELHVAVEQFCASLAGGSRRGSRAAVSAVHGRRDYSSGSMRS